MNSVAFELFGLSVHWYGLIIAIGLICAIALAIFTAKYRGFDKDDPYEIILWMFPFAIIGARLYFLIFNGGPWGWQAFAIWDGGIAIYGAILGGVVGALLYCYFRHKNFIKLADFAVPSVILGQGIGRIGCYCSGCCYGIETTNTAFQCFPFSIQIGGTWHLATMLYESFFDIIICAILLIILKKSKTNGVVFAGYMIMYGILRFLLEGIRGESLMLGSVRVSQLLSLIIALLGIGFMIYILIKNKKGSIKLSLK